MNLNYYGEVKAQGDYQALKKNHGVVWLLWWFLGMFGAHRFYLNRREIAIVQLVLTLTVIGSPVTLVWVIVDAFFLNKMLAEENMWTLKELRVYYGAEKEITSEEPAPPPTPLPHTFPQSHEQAEGNYDR